MDHSSKADDAVEHLRRAAGRPLPAVLLSALCYLADRVSVARHGHPMFGSSYVEGAIGPACPAVEASLSTGQGSRGSIDLDELSVADTRCLDAALASHGHMDPDALAKWMSAPGNLPEREPGGGAPTLEEMMAAVAVPDPAGQAAFVRETERVAALIGALAQRS